MKHFGAFEAKTHFSTLLEDVAHGEHIVITKHGRPIARIIPFSGSSRDRISQTIRRIHAFGMEHPLGDLDWKELRDEGRR